MTGTNAKFIGEEAIKNGYNEKNVFYFENKELLQENLKQNLQKGDVILIKASNGMKLFDIADNLKKEYSI